MTHQPNNVSAAGVSDLPPLPKPCQKGWIYDASQMRAYALEAVAAASAQATGQTVEFDGDSKATRKAFRDYDAEYPVRHRSDWQIWRDAIAYASKSGVAALLPAAREAGKGVTLTDEQVLEHFNIPGLNIEASLEPRELELFLNGARALLREAGSR